MIRESPIYVLHMSRQLVCFSVSKAVATRHSGLCHCEDEDEDGSRDGEDRR